MSVSDNLLLVHSLEAKVVLIFDLKINTQFPISAPLPLGLIRPGEAGGCQLCNTCNSFPCRIHAKSDAEVCCVKPILAFPNVTLRRRALAQRLLTNAAGVLFVRMRFKDE